MSVAGTGGSGLSDGRAKANWRWCAAALLSFASAHETSRSLANERDGDRKHEHIGDSIKLLGRRFAHQPDAEEIGGHRKRQQGRQRRDIARRKLPKRSEE